MDVVLDSSVLVALLMHTDRWHSAALSILDALESCGHTTVYFDCVVAESASAAIRRLHEKRAAGEVGALMERLESHVPYSRITWILPRTSGLYRRVLDLMRFSEGALNFNDALIALSCRERGITAIASFDADFDQVPWLARWGNAEDVTA